jgi:hypothetical protein
VIGAPLQPNRMTAAVLGFLLGMASGVSCWLVIFRIEAVSGLSRYLPGALLGAFICIGGRAILGAPRASVTRLGALILTVMLAWRLAQTAQGFGGWMQWFSASLIGALGAGAGMLIAWPLHTGRSRLLLAMTAVGLGGGVLFTLMSGLRLQGARVTWALAVLCIWHCALLTAAAVCLQGTRRAAI